ncbi:putative Sel1 repeat domain-containing protein [Helicobacter cholecystus]|nr:putative Sel1 repeat domain-containing protein [Helicobacter cholecystus]
MLKKHIPILAKVKMGNFLSKVFLVTLVIVLSGCKGKVENLKEALSKYQDRNFKEALFYFERACLEGQIYACQMTASLYLNGKAGSKSKAKSLKALEYACQWGDTSSCKITYHSYNTLALSPLANKMLEYGCQGGESELCSQLALNLYKNKNFKSSLETANKACYGGSLKGCHFYLALAQKYNPDPLKIKAIEIQIQKLIPQKKI